MKELLILFAVKPALTTGLLRWFVVATDLVCHGADSGEGDLPKRGMRFLGKIPQMGEVIHSRNGDGVFTGREPHNTPSKWLAGTTDMTSIWTLAQINWVEQSTIFSTTLALDSFFGLLFWEP